MSISERTILTTSQDLDAERGLRLARFVSIGFAAFTFVLLILFLIKQESIPVTITGNKQYDARVILIVVAVGIICIILNFTAFYLTTQNQGKWAARLIIIAIISLLLAFQISRTSQYGLDSVVIASFTAELVPIGLASVLESTSLMFFIASIVSIFSGLIIWVGNQGPAETPKVWLAFAIILVVYWTISLLIFGASTLYIQSLEEIGSLRKAYERSVQLEKLKDQFITHVNHELRTPIMTMQGTMEFLGEARSSLPESAQIELIQQARRNTQRLVDLLSNILDARNIERSSQDIDIEPVQVLEVVKAAVEFVDPQHIKAIAISVDSRKFVLGQKTAIIQILTNYLSNAIKYSPLHAPIEITIQYIAAKDGKKDRSVPEMIEIHVKDAGPGIPPDQIQLLFNRFVRLERDLASNISGNGLGLYLSKTLAESMGGEVGAISPASTEGGSIFWLRLPSVQMDEGSQLFRSPKATP